MIKAYNVNREQLSIVPIGQIKGMGKANKYRNTVIGYIGGEIPILIETNLTQDEWDKYSNGNLTQGDIFALKIRGIL